MILAASPGSALRDVDGVPNVRRLADTAWAGGALPIVVVVADPDGAVAGALAGSTAILASPAPREAGPVGQVCRGIDAALGEVDGTAAALVWPVSMGWVDAETVTSLIEAHGAHRGSVLRPAYRGVAGWPALVTVAHLERLRTLDASLDPEELMAVLVAATGGRVVEVGDPGTTHDFDTPLAQLPPYEAPPEPVTGERHEWGSLAAAGPDEPPAPARTVDRAAR